MVVVPAPREQGHANDAAQPISQPAKHGAHTQPGQPVGQPVEDEPHSGEQAGHAYADAAVHAVVPPIHTKHRAQGEQSAHAQDKRRAAIAHARQRGQIGLIDAKRRAGQPDVDEDEEKTAAADDSLVVLHATRGADIFARQAAKPPACLKALLPSPPFFAKRPGLLDRPSRPCPWPRAPLQASRRQPCGRARCPRARCRPPHPCRRPARHAVRVSRQSACSRSR